MYLGCTLLDCGFDIASPGNEGPDLCSHVGNKRVWFEATAPSAGTGSDQVPKPIPGNVVAKPEEQILLRLTSAIEAKRTHFEKSENSEIVSQEDGAVICINGRNVPHTISDHPPELIVRAVFPIGNFQYTVDKNTLEVVDSGFEFRSTIHKASGSAVSTGSFTDHSSARIAAVIYSRVDSANHPSRLGDDFVCVHNPNAQHPLPIGFLGRGIEYYALNSTLVRLEHNIERNFFLAQWHRTRIYCARLRYWFTRSFT